jgi:release factor glutamine methyltransferase
LRIDASPLALEPAVPRAEALTRVAAFLAWRGVEDARREARILLLAAAQIAHADLLLEPDAPLDAGTAMALINYAARRGAREPVSRIVGARGFWTLDLAVAPMVLDPRADTETLVELTLREMSDRRCERLSILDLGSGSGAIICALLSELPNARAFAVDRSAPACAATRTNLARCGLSDRAQILQSDWADAISAAFDLVVSNPPYIRSGDIKSLAPEVRLHDPTLALDGGADGFGCYRRIASQLTRLLAPNGLAVLEVGAGQAEQVRRLLDAEGLKIVATAKDANGCERAIAARWFGGQA